MLYKFSDSVSFMEPSSVQDILKTASAPGFIPFSAGNPASEAFPKEAVAAIAAEILENRPVDAMQYSVTEGYEPLREYLLKYMREKHSAGKASDSIIITSGAQQAISLTAEVLCNPGDTVICEDPSFVGALDAFRSFGAKLVGIPTGADGMDIAALEAALDAHPETKFIYTIPSFQNPTGTCMPLERRKEVYRLAKKHGVIILEDNPYGDTRFEGDDIPLIKSFDEDGLVVYAGTFSKVISPGLRVGYAIAPAEIISKMTACKQTGDVHTTVLSQMICHEFLTKYNFEAHLDKIREVYRRKCGLMVSMLDSQLSGYIDYYRPQGGLFIWCRIKGCSDSVPFCAAAAERTVAAVPGTVFLADTSKKSGCFRINYSTPTDEQIVSGVKLLGQTAKDF